MESLLIRLVNRDSPKHLEHQGVLLFFLFLFFSAHDRIEEWHWEAGLSG